MKLYKHDLDSFFKIKFPIICLPNHHYQYHNANWARRPCYINNPSWLLSFCICPHDKQTNIQKLSVLENHFIHDCKKLTFLYFWRLKCGVLLGGHDFLSKQTYWKMKISPTSLNKQHPRCHTSHSAKYSTSIHTFDL